MKKLLLTALVCGVSLAGFAQTAGDYVYSGAHRLKITTGENLFANGDFANGTAGWTTEGGRTLNADTFQIVNDGPDGSQCLYVALKDNGPKTGSALYRKIPVRAGNTYYISYSVKADEDVTTTTTQSASGKNYQNVFFNTDGSLTPQLNIARAQSYSTDWKTVAYSVTAPEDGFVVFDFYAPYIGTRFDDFKVLGAMEVADDRVVSAMEKRLQAYIDNPLFPNGHETLSEVIGELKDVLALDDKATMDDMLNTVESEVIPGFLDQNSVNVSNYLKAPDFDELATTGTLKSGTETTYGDAWTVEGLRWRVADADNTFNSHYIQRSVSGGYTLDEGKLYQTSTVLPAGKYMFSMKANALRYKDKYENVLDGYDIRGMKIFINGDSTECFPVDTARVSTYEVYADVKEGEPITVGFYMPGGVANVVNLDFTQLRAIGASQEAIDSYVAKCQLAESKATLQASIDSASVYTNSADYIYDKDTLSIAIDAAKAIYNSSENIDEVVVATDSINENIRQFLKHNKIYRSLMDGIANAEQLLADEKYTIGKTGLKAAISTAREYAATLPGNVRDDDATQIQVNMLNDALSKYILANSTSGQDESFSFAQWADSSDPVYATTLSNDAVTTSGGAELYTETAPFAGNDMKGRFAFPQDKSNRTIGKGGIDVNYTGKNAIAMAILNLKAGDQVTVDWAMDNRKHNVYVASGNASYVNAKGETVQLTLVGTKAKKDQCKLSAENNDGVGGMTRTVFTMSADGSLDFFFGSSNSTMTIGFVGIKHADPTAIEAVNAGTDTIRNNDIYSINGQKVRGNATSLEGLPKGIYIFNGRKYVVR